MLAKARKSEFSSQEVWVLKPGSLSSQSLRLTRWWHFWFVYPELELYNQELERKCQESEKKISQLQEQISEILDKFEQNNIRQNLRNESLQGQIEYIRGLWHSATTPSDLEPERLDELKTNMQLSIMRAKYSTHQFITCDVMLISSHEELHPQFARLVFREFIKNNPKALLS